MLLLTTVYLFHLPHAHHTPEDVASNLDGDSHSPGGSALRHKMDLDHILLKKYDGEHGGRSQNRKASTTSRSRGPRGRSCKLQGRLLDEGVLPDPILPTHTAREFSGLPPDPTPALM